MTLISHSISLPEQFQNSYTQLWLSLKNDFERLDPGWVSSTGLETSLLARLRSIKNALVGSRARKLFTITDPLISRELNILTCILESDRLDLNIIYWKIEAAAIVGLLSIPEDQTVYALLRAQFPNVIIDSINRFAQKVPIRSLLTVQSPTRQVEHNLLQTLLRTLSSLYGIIQDVSSPRKWGYMTKSPERVHQPASRRAAGRSHCPSPVNKMLFRAENSPRLDLKGKAKALMDTEDKVITKPTSLDSEDSVTFSQDLWPVSKPNKLKEACEQANALLATQIVYRKTFLPLIFAISPPSKTLAEGSMVNLSLASIADLAVPCFQLIWLLCKDTQRQLWFVRKLIETEDPDGIEDSCLKALTNCLRFWLHSHHDLAIEYSIRTIGGLLSIHESPRYAEDPEFLEYLDQLIWAQSVPSALPSYPIHETARFSSLNDCGVGWVLTCRVHEGSPILRAALVTSIVSLVKHFPNIRLRMLLLQIHHTIELMDNASHSIAVRSEAACALAHALTISETLQYEAFEAKVIPVLKKLIDKASEDPVPYPTPAIITQNAMLKESAFLALASLMSTLDAPRKEVIDLNLLPEFVKSLADESILVRAASCQCCRALSRSISVVRTKLADEGAGSRLFDLAFGLDHCYDDTESVGHNDWVGDEDDDLDEDAVEVQLKLVAMGALCNLVLDFSPMKDEVLSRNGIEKFVKLLKFSKYQSLKESALWGLKNIIFSASVPLKTRVISSLGWDQIFKCLEDKSLSIQENIISFLRNLACGEISDAEILFKQLTSNSSDIYHNRLINLLEDKLSLSLSSSDIYHANDNIHPSSLNVINNSPRENILIQTIYTFSNLATGSVTHKNFVLGRPRIMKSLLESLSHPNPEVQIGAIWCVINLTHFDEDTKSRVIMNTINVIEELGIVSKLKAICDEFNQDGHEHNVLTLQSNHENTQKKFFVKERADCALHQIFKTKERFFH